MTLVLPVIHHLDDRTTLEQAELAISCGADGVFLISMTGEADDVLPQLAATLKGRLPGKKIGINLLTRSVIDAYQAALDLGIEMVWADFAGVSSGGLSDAGTWLKGQIAANGSQGPQLFASVAFKYQRLEVDPAGAALQAYEMGAVPTTSGSKTGSAPAIEKIRSMREASPLLAAASGFDCENVAPFVPYLTHILVSTGVSRDDHHFDPDKLTRFVQIVRETEAQLAVGTVTAGPARP